MTEIRQPSDELTIELCAAVTKLVDAVAVVVQAQDRVAESSVDLPDDEEAVVTVKFKNGGFFYQLDEDDDIIKITVAERDDENDIVMVIRVGGE